MMRQGSATHIAAIIIVVVAVLFFYGAALGFASMTLAPMWMVIAIALVAAGVTAPALAPRWKVITCTTSVIWNVLCHLVFTAGAVMAVLLGVNWLGRHKDEVTSLRVPVERVYSETRHRSRRVGRRVYADGGEYHVYMMDVRFPDGSVHTLPLSLTEYNNRQRRQRRQRTDSIDVDLTPGAFRWMVFVRK